MKKSILVLLTVLFCFFACKKNNRDSNTGSTTGNGKTYPITFSLNPASGNSLASGPVDTAFTNHIKTLAYALYDISGNQIDQVAQDTTFSNFGVINAHVPAGTYYAYFMANSIYKYNTTPPYFYPMDVTGSKDVFYRKDTIVVSNAAINQNIVMGRTTAKLVLDIQDTVPKSVGSLQISMGNTYPYKMSDTSYLIIPNDFSGPVGYLASTHNFTPSERGKAHLKISMFVYNPDLLHNVTLTVSTPGAPATTPIVIKNVKFIRNHITTLTGSVFNNTTVFDSGFKVSINTDWNTSSISF